MMTIAMEMHDSYLREICCDPDGRGYARFHAVIYRSEGKVFEDVQESGWQDVRFDFEGMRLEGEVADLSCDPYAAEGDLWVDGKNQNGVIYLPATHFGEICLEMRIAPLFETFKIHASRIDSGLQGEFELEMYWDIDGKTTRA
jgi:hypothetical protein